MPETQFVGVYLAKAKEAERLRALQKAMGATTWDEGTVKTQGNGNFPGQEQVNWGSALGKLGLAFMGRDSEEKAVEAEAAQAEARMAGLKNLLSGGKELGPEQILQAEQYGVDPATIKLMQGTKPNLGAVTQAAATPAGRAALVQMGTITQEQADQMAAAADAGKSAEAKAAEEAYLFEQNNKRFAPNAPNQPTSEQVKIDLWKTDPKLAAQIYGDKTNAGEGGAGGGRYDRQRELDTLRANTAELRSLIEGPKGDDIFSFGQKAAHTAQNTGERIGGITGGVMNAVGIAAETPEAALMRRIGQETALESLAKMAPASDADFRALMRIQANPIQTKEAAMEFIRLAERIVARADAGEFDQAAPAAPSVEDWSIVE